MFHVSELVRRTDEWVNAHTNYNWQKDIFSEYRFKVLEIKDADCLVEIVHTPAGYEKKFLNQKFWNPMDSFLSMMDPAPHNTCPIEEEVEDAGRFDIDL